MEADWSAEIAPGLPEIIVPWSAENPADASVEILVWRDLRNAGPQLEAAIQSIPCAAQEPALADALRTLHMPGSPWFTSKCDYWTAAPDDGDAPDPYEFDAADLIPSQTTDLAPLHLCASYLDILSRDAAAFASFAAHEHLLDSVVATLRTQPQRHARIDLVLRAARMDNTDGFAFTAYAAGCGISGGDAHRAWQQALRQLITTLCNMAP